MPMGIPLDLIGHRFGRLTVIDREAKPVRWLCRCDCGTEKWVATLSLRAGSTVSCGCYARDKVRLQKPARTHGLTGTKEFIAWMGMRRRCSSPKELMYPRYGGRGIKVCERWEQSFENFLADMGKAPSPGHSVDRINPDGDYSPSNCRWASRKVQSRNQTRNRMLTWDGRTRLIVEWAEEVGINAETIKSRLKRGWSAEEALTKPPGTKLRFANQWCSREHLSKKEKAPS